uniref:Uncharacterized protein n=1 Tax=Aegilops tauschii subsp. strangulata TaxID=200361 RepID=A0A452YS65_AEGTS
TRDVSLALLFLPPLSPSNETLILVPVVSHAAPWKSRTRTRTPRPAQPTCGAASGSLCPGRRTTDPCHGQAVMGSLWVWPRRPRLRQRRPWPLPPWPLRRTLPPSAWLCT